ncbi:MAG: PTS sugar transporter subunit IIA [Pseudomonadota bacterium]
MTGLSNLLDESSILDPLDLENVDDILSALAERLALRSGIGKGAILSALRARLAEDPVGAGNGVAIPHARLENAAAEPVGVFARLSAPVDFQSHDERPCDLVFALLTPLNNDTAHLKALAQVARTFRDNELRATLRGSKGEAAAILLGDSSHGAAA